MTDDERRRREPPYRGDPFTERARDGLGFRRVEDEEPRLPPALLPYLGRPDSQRPRIMIPMGQPPEPDPSRHMFRVWYGFLPVVILLLVLSRLTGQELGGLVWMAIGALWCRYRYREMKREAARADSLTRLFLTSWTVGFAMLLPPALRERTTDEPMIADQIAWSTTPVPENRVIWVEDLLESCRPGAGPRRPSTSCLTRITPEDQRWYQEWLGRRQRPDA